MSNNIRSENGLSLVEAVETLTQIADLENESSAEFFLRSQEGKAWTTRWLQNREGKESIGLMKETFKVIMSYLKKVYYEDYSYIRDPVVVEKIKTIMVLVGEAAKKLDKQVQSTEKKIVELKEYRELQEFYLNRIARRIDEGILGKWILGLTQLYDLKQKKWGESGKQVSKGLEGSRVFVDLESVKKDTEYELFFIRKEDGSRYFSPRLIRNIKLVCDFGESLQEGAEGVDPSTGTDL